LSWLTLSSLLAADAWRQGSLLGMQHPILDMNQII